MRCSFAKLHAKLLELSASKEHPTLTARMSSVKGDVEVKLVFAEHLEAGAHITHRENNYTTGIIVRDVSHLPPPLGSDAPLDCIRHFTFPLPVEEFKASNHAGTTADCEDGVVGLRVGNFLL